MEALLQHFHEALTTEADVEQLKKLILQLAFQGKLVQQNPNDEPVTVLLQKIEDEKKRLFREKKIKREKPLPLVSQEDEPYEIPNYWKWVRLGKVCNYGSAEKAEFHSTSTDCWILELEDIEKATSTLLKKVMVRERSFSSSKNVFYANDVLYGRLRPYLDKVIVADEGGVCSTEILPIRGYYGIYPKYLMYALKRPDFLQYIDSKMYGMKMPRLGTEDGRNALLPLPPYNEQVRITSRIEELFALCSTLKEEIKQKEQSSSVINKSVFTKIQDYSNPLQLEDLQFVIDNMEHLCNTKEDIALLRNSILSLGIQGTLVEQSQTDEVASVVLEKIREEKDKVVITKKIKKDKKTLEITKEEKPFNLPNGWEWVRLQEISHLITKGSSPKWQGVKYTENPDDVLFVTSENVGNFNLILKKKKYVEKKFNEIEPRSILQKGDLLMNIVGASIGRTAIFNLDECANINQAVCLIRLTQMINKEYLLLFFNSQLCISYMFNNQVENARANLSMSNIAKFLVPLPPLNEQKRIVEKVNQMMKLCDELEHNIEQFKQESEKLMKAVLQEALAVKEEVLN
ncbi:restriction endonuclease subunit S [Peribacillus simplex]|uniref:restriction endonuclease subunit S n=1 Tax=Peribacillus simplex TaxID=1478 RepID=UPI0024C166DB|nr:restriction endonuclease subunit S [Peribacillus simplex]WHX92020.1 restriction endonuclease subunit S [Peribacillus simplex]